jgi:hypothetical protein
MSNYIVRGNTNPYDVISLGVFFEQGVMCKHDSFVLCNVIKLIMDALGAHAEEGRI